MKRIAEERRVGQVNQDKKKTNRLSAYKSNFFCLCSFVEMAAPSPYSIFFGFLEFIEPCAMHTYFPHLLEEISRRWERGLKHRQNKEQLKAGEIFENLNEAYYLIFQSLVGQIIMKHEL